MAVEGAALRVWVGDEQEGAVVKGDMERWGCRVVLTGVGDIARASMGEFFTGGTDVVSSEPSSQLPSSPTAGTLAHVPTRPHSMC